MKNRKDTYIQIELFFIRHSESCANLAKKNKRIFTQGTYRDPELTSTGRAMAKEYSTVLFDTILPTLGWKPSDTLFASSDLLRAQQTLESITDSKHIEPLYVFPHIQESSISLDNVPRSKNLQKPDLQKTRKRHDLRNTGVGYIPSLHTSNFQKFQEWLLTEFINKNPNVDTSKPIRIVIVSHGRFLRTVLETIVNSKAQKDRRIETIHNLDGFRIDMNYKKEHDSNTFIESNLVTKAVPNTRAYKGRDLYKKYMWSYIPSDSVVIKDSCSMCRRSVCASNKETNQRNQTRKQKKD